MQALNNPSGLWKAHLLWDISLGGRIAMNSAGATAVHAGKPLRLVQNQFDGADGFVPFQDLNGVHPFRQWA